MGGSGDGSIGEPPHHGKWPDRTEPTDPRSRRTIQSQDPGLRQPGGIGEGPECCHNQKLMQGSPLAYCEPVMLVTPPDVE
jgi:hypothetical protein